MGSDLYRGFWITCQLRLDIETNGFCTVACLRDYATLDDVSRPGTLTGLSHDWSAVFLKRGIWSNKAMGGEISSLNNGM